MGTVNERRHYYVIPSLIGQTHKDILSFLYNENHGMNVTLAQTTDSLHIWVDYKYYSKQYALIILCIIGMSTKMYTFIYSYTHIYKGALALSY